MKYYQPFGDVDANASYTNGNAGLGVKGSIPDARAIEHPQREIIEVISAAGLTPDQAILTQLRQAIQLLASNALNSPGNSILGRSATSTGNASPIALAANRFLARSSSGAIQAKTITDAALGLLDDPDAPAMLTTLGVSNYIKNLLDDADALAARGTLGLGAIATKEYEEGNFTPVAYGTSTAGLGTYGGNSGRYTRTGNIVWFSLSINWSAHSGAGNLRIGGLPYAASYEQACAVHYENLTIGAGKSLSAVIFGGNTFISLQSADPSGGLASAVPMDAAVNGLIISGSYRI